MDKYRILAWYHSKNPKIALRKRYSRTVQSLEKVQELRELWEAKRLEVHSWKLI